MKNRILLIIFSLFTLSLTAQEPLLEEYVYEDTLTPVYGPNLQHYLYSYVGYAFVAGPSEDGMPVKYGNAGSVVWGIKYKYRLNNTFALGLGLSYTAQYYPLKQDSSKLFPNKVHHQKERFSFNNIGVDAFTRLNFNKRRGNVIGTYADIGGYLDWVVVSKYYTKDLSPAASGSKFTETSYTQLTTIHNLNHGLMVKVGHKGFAAFAKYRLSDIFIDSSGLPDLPRLMLGIEIGTIN